MQMYVYSESVYNTLYIEINTNIKKISFWQNKRYKKCLLFSLVSSNTSQFYSAFNFLFLCELKHKVCLSKTVCGIFHLRFCFVLLKFILLFNKMNELFDFKRSWFLSKSNNRKATHSFAPRPLIFKFHQEVLKFSDICVGCSPPKTDLETNFLSLANRSLESVSFPQ